MVGAASVLQEAYGFNREDAQGFLKAWMENFGKDND
jgi:hypothetical protein